MKFCPSCDTLAIPAAYSETGCNIFAKNSDRDVTEAQPLIFFQAEDHVNEKMVQCTYIPVEQVQHTYAMIGSKPWWIWGFEMGVNEWGVAVGNEAEWANVPVADADALLGMDLVRLGLERSKTAREALHVIIRLLERYGQGGACKYGTSRSDSAYHNSFILADPLEVYLLETVDRHWVYRRLNDVQGISNVYSIGREYDAASKDIDIFAESKGLHTAGQPFDFSKSFMLLNYHYMGGFSRSQWSTKMLRGKRGHLNAENVLEILRGHYEGDTIENRWSAVGGCVPCVCMHGSEPTHTHSAASMVVEYHKTAYRELLFTYWGSVCPPCCSIIVPFYNAGYIPRKLGAGENYYDEASFWWKVNRMAADIESNYERYHGWLDETRKNTEKEFRRKDIEVRGQAEAMLKEGKADEARKILNSFTDECLSIAETMVEKLTEEIENDMRNIPGEIYRAAYLDSYRKKVNMPIGRGPDEEETRSDLL